MAWHSISRQVDLRMEFKAAASGKPEPREPRKEKGNDGRKKETTKFTKSTKKRDREFHTQEQAELRHECLNLS
jgi:hypothetical protein